MGICHRAFCGSPACVAEHATGAQAMSLSLIL
jgi:hypothetical protein